VSYTYEYPRPAVTVDCVVFARTDDGLQVLLIERDGEPYAGRWALPGGFVEMDEDLETAARRELHEETGVVVDSLEQLHTFGAVDRDPRGRVISVAYYGLTTQDRHTPRAASDARRVGWFAVDKPPSLAFDHGAALRMAIARLQATER